MIQKFYYQVQIQEDCLQINLYMNVDSDIIYNSKGGNSNIQHVMNG